MPVDVPFTCPAALDTERYKRFVEPELALACAGPKDVFCADPSGKPIGAFNLSQ